MGDDGVLVVQHEEPEGPALVGAALARAGVAIDVVRIDLGRPLPVDLARRRGLVILGGPMSASSDDGFPTRGAEVALAVDAIERGVPMLGICLGAQVLAVAAGSTIRPAEHPEIGWGTVRVEPGASGDPLFDGITGELAVLHWHEDTFDLPAGAVHLASSNACPSQAFRAGPSAWGLQFHLEVDRAAVERFVASFGHETDDPEALLAATDAQLARSASERDRILGRFAATCAAVA